MQIPSVQNWTAQKVTHFLSKELNTKVSLDHISLEFFDKVVLEGVYIEDFDGDTLLYSKRIRANLNTEPISWFNRYLAFEDIALSGTFLNIKKKDGATDSNLNAFLNQFKKKDPNKKNPFFFNIEQLLLKNIKVLNINEVAGETQSYIVESGTIDVEIINLPAKKYFIKSVKLRKPAFSIEKYQPGTPPPPREEQIANTDSISTNVDTTVFQLKIRALQLTEGSFVMDNFRHSASKMLPDSIFDPQHLKFKDINMNHENLVFSEGQLNSFLKHLSLEESSGFKVLQLTAKEFKLANNALIFNQMNLETPYSSLGDTFAMKFRNFGDFSNFNDKVLMQAHFKDASFAVKDIMVFAPALQRNTFFQNNRDEILTIDGEISGRVNNLRGRELNIKLARGAIFEGDFSSRNLAVHDEEFLNLRVEQLRTTMKTVKEILPKFNLPANFMKLGNLDFSGSFDGFFTDFVAFGDLKTNLGRATLDMRLNLKNKLENAEYSGRLSLLNFNLQKWTDNPDLGNITFSSEVVEGRGLTGNSANAKLTATVDTFVYKNYRYKNIGLTGELNKSLFDGNLVINDENIDLVFAGEIDFTDSIPKFNFLSNVNKIALKPLNLSRQDLAFQGQVEINIVDINLSNMQGDLAVYNFKMIKDDAETFEADSILASSSFDDANQKQFVVESDLLSAALYGNFDIQSTPEALMQYLERNFPEFMTKFGLKSKGKQLNPSKFTYDIKIKDAFNFTHLVSPKLDSVKNLSFKGYFDSFSEKLKIDLVLPTLKFDNWFFYDLALQSKLEGGYGNLDAAVSKTVLNKNTEFSPISVLGLIQRDTYEFGLTSLSPLFQTVENMNLNGKFFLSNDAYQITFLPSNIVIWQDNWDIKKDNYIRFGNKKIETRNFEFTNENRRIVFESLGDRGLTASVENFNLNFINDMWKYDRLKFYGNFKITAVIKDIYEFRQITAVGEMDSVMINDDLYGRMQMDVAWDNVKSPVIAKIDVRKPGQSLTIDGSYYSPAAARATKMANKTAYPPHYFEGDITMNNYPLSILEYFIGGSISNTEGLVSGDLSISGKPDKPDIQGKAVIKQAAVTINYLQTRYTFDDAVVGISNTLIDATGGKIQDKFGNTAVVFGGITHDHFKNFGLDARILSDRFLVLDTQKENNPLYYGRGIGKGDIRFTGSFKQTNISIDAVTANGTKIYLPISSGGNASEVKFVKFKDKTKTAPEKENQPALTELRGVNLDMQLTATPDAEMFLIFDERAGDVIHGTGSGDIRLRITREGEFNMYGTYQIEEGEYLFTLLNLVNKPFTVKRGGTITWFGDPFGADINLVAEYKGLSTPVSNLIQEYLAILSQDVRSEAAKPTQVDLTMLLQGQLLKPNIFFDIDFPALSGDLKNYAVNKLRVIKQDQNELNRQVFGLIVAGQFLPSTYQLSGGEILTNTLTELLANQLSLYLTELLSEVVTDVKVISGVDLDIAYSSYNSVDLTTSGGTPLSGNELQLRLKNYFFNDRLSVNVGGNFNLNDNNQLGTTVNAGSFTAGDIIIEYALTDDRRLKLRAYASQEVVIGGGIKRKVGGGISYRNEFDTFQEFLNGFRRTVKKIETDK